MFVEDGWVYSFGLGASSMLVSSEDWASGDTGLSMVGYDA